LTTNGRNFFRPAATGEVRPVAEHAPTHKTCSGCCVVKPIKEFNFKYRAKGVRHSYCRECGKRLTRSHYKRNKRSYLKRNLRAYAERRQLVPEAKSRPRADCGVHYPYYVMDFDHGDGWLKEFSLNALHRVTKRAILREIEKCDVVCSNCHRERTHRRRVKGSG